MNSVRFHRDAELEMIDTAAWYESQNEGLGKHFLASVQDSIQRIQITPQLFPLVEGDVRRCLTNTFPFSVLFRIQIDSCIIVAIMHHRREPDYWKSRLGAG